MLAPRLWSTATGMSLRLAPLARPLFHLFNSRARPDKETLERRSCVVARGCVQPQAATSGEAPRSRGAGPRAEESGVPSHTDMRLRISLGHDGFLLAGLALALLTIFDPTIGRTLQLASEVEAAYHVRLLPALVVPRHAAHRPSAHARARS